MKKRILALVLSMGLLLHMALPGILAVSLDEAGTVSTFTTALICGNTEHQHDENCYAAQETTETTEPERLTLYEQLLACQTCEELYDALLDVTDPMALTVAEIDALLVRWETLPYDDEDERDDCKSLLMLLRSQHCTCGTQTREHGEGCPCKERVEAETYASGYQTGDGYVIYYANTTNAGMFKGNSYTSVSYNASTDTIQLRGTAEQGDPNVGFEIAAAELTAETYPYVVLTYRANKNDTTELFEWTSTHPSAEAGQSETFTTIADGKFHSAIMNPGQDGAWKGTINGFRFDYYTLTSVGDLYEIDSIAFCKTLDDANYVKWERESVLNNHGVFSASDAVSAKAMARLFHLAGHSNVVVSHTEDAVVLTAQNLCDVSHITSGFDCNAFGDAAAFDPMIVFHIPGSIDDEYKYMVMTYKTPDDPKGVYYDISSQYPDRIQTFEEFKNTLNVQVFPQTSSGNTAQEKYSRNFQIYEKDVYYSDYVLLEDDLKPSTVSVIRIDPFAVHYATAGSQLYISSIIFCKSLDDADDKIEEELEDKYPYDYELIYDGNAPEGAVTNLPVQEFAMRTDQSEMTFTVSAQVPVRANYTFKGWSTSKNAADILTDGKITLRGEENQTKTQTLYAIWEENKATVQYQVIGPEGGAALTSTSESIFVVTGTATGTTATAATGFKITGWYTDPACTQAVNTSFITNIGNGTYTTTSTLKPTKDESAAWANITYYVKVEYAVADLTITTGGLDGEYSYIFTITGTPSDTTIVFTPMTVVINGNGSKIIKSLPVGQYTVTEGSGWSWRFVVEDDAVQQVTVDGNGDHSVTFDAYTAQTNKWLDGSAYYRKKEG